MALWFTGRWSGLETYKPKRHVPRAETICITLERLVMGIMLPETCLGTVISAIKTILLHPVGLSFPRINNDERSNSHTILEAV
jgi:hypothetical protein